MEEIKYIYHFFQEIIRATLQQQDKDQEKIKELNDKIQSLQAE